MIAVELEVEFQDVTVGMLTGGDEGKDVLNGIDHQGLLHDLNNELIRRLKECECPRGLYVIDVDPKAGMIGINFLMAEDCGVANLVAQDIPKVVARTISSRVRAYDSRSDALVLILETCKDRSRRIASYLLRINDPPKVGYYRYPPDALRSAF